MECFQVTSVRLFGGIAKNLELQLQKVVMGKYLL